MADDTQRPLMTEAPVLEGEALKPEAQEKTNYKLSELLALEIEEEECLFSPIFTRCGIAVLVGGSDSGKTNLCRQMGISVSTGRNFLNWEFRGIHNRAYFYSSEDDETQTAIKVKRNNKTLRIPPKCADNLEFIFDTPDSLATDLEQRLTDNPADLVIIDTLSDYMANEGLDVTKNVDVRKFYGRFAQIARRFNCLILFNHHTGKRTSTFAPDKDNTLGAQSIEAKPRLAIELRSDPDNTATKHLCVTKCNYLGSDFKTKSFALVMDENFVFEATGDGKEFADLAKDLKKQEKKPKNPKKVKDEEHKDFIKKIFRKSKNGKLSLTEIRENIELDFETSTTTAKTFLTYYKNKNWIEFAEKGKGRTEYYKTALVY